MFRKWTNLVKNKAEIQIPVILASESPRRKAMLSELNIPFQAFHWIAGKLPITGTIPCLLLA